ncbi:histidine utilization repressor [Aureimonas flava]|uniref:Histidine utilization repressor n=1 Tax=Aureimonas flava TaxID=2320271 RepID=A0A3A1WHU7_9HYPH|nr:histidine utilization repressor [Aureimonas flava]RIX97754.1 histidine utilization repressor [Aureimonas flava]
MSLLEDFGGAADAPVADETPLYARLKHYIRSRVESGEWPPEHRVPSENEFVEHLGISRMTANRALRELAAEGIVTRVRGKGSFVSSRKRSSAFQSVPNIADEITLRGRQHHAEVIVHQHEICGPDLAEALDGAIGASVFHSVIVHKEDDLPIQIEDRFVNPDRARAYLEQDFLAVTPNSYLSAVAPIVRSEQFIEAVTAQPWECRLLGIGRSEPCLLVRRRTWSREGVVSAVRLVYPGSRYRLESTS